MKACCTQCPLRARIVTVRVRMAIRVADCAEMAYAGAIKPVNAAAVLNDSEGMGAVLLCQQEHLGE